MNKKNKKLEASRKWKAKNKEKLKKYRAEYYLKNKEKEIERSKIQALKNPEKNRENARNWRVKHPERARRLGKDQRLKHKANNNALKAKYRARKISSSPKWLSTFDLEYIKNIYKQATELSKLDNEKYHVDHIIPLQGETVCGLHVPWNLQIITMRENISKGNKLIGV